MTQPLYAYLFDAEIPGWNHPGTFHSVDLWFFFEALAKSWRPQRERQSGELEPFLLRHLKQ